MLEKHCLLSRASYLVESQKLQNIDTEASVIVIRYRKYVAMLDRILYVEQLFQQLSNEHRKTQGFLKTHKEES